MQCFVGAAVGPSNPCQQLHARQRLLWPCYCYASNRQVKKKEKGNADSVKAVLYIRVGHMILKQAGCHFVYLRMEQSMFFTLLRYVC